jgi:cysteine desulfurase
MLINYFDNASTTKVDSRVLEVMLPYFNEFYGNASSNHLLGKTSKLAIYNVCKLVPELIETKTKHFYIIAEAYKFNMHNTEYQ